MLLAIMRHELFYKNSITRKSIENIIEKKLLDELELSYNKQLTEDQMNKNRKEIDKSFLERADAISTDVKEEASIALINIKDKYKKANSASLIPTRFSR